ncbi:type II toxin-antitoxin system death-on-curing family toxin [Candidatus Moduliflexota bacterium]
MIKHLSLDEVLAVHSRLIDRFGGAAGVIDLGLLDSALHRPRTGYYGDVAEMAAALFESLLMNLPFVDGSKRVAFFATDVFLRLNGWKFSVEAAEAHGFVISLLEKKQSDMKHLLPWVRRSMTRL